MLKPSDQLAQRIYNHTCVRMSRNMPLQTRVNLPQGQQARLRSLLSDIIIDEKMLKTDAHDTLAIKRLTANYAEFEIVKTSFEAK